MPNEKRTGMYPYLCFCYRPIMLQTHYYATLNIDEQRRGIRHVATQHANAVTMSAVSRVASVTCGRARASDVILQLHAWPHVSEQPATETLSWSRPPSVEWTGRQLTCQAMTPGRRCSGCLVRRMVVSPPGRPG